MPKQWKAEEIVVTCEAYIGATDNPIDSTDQEFHTFTVDLIDRFTVLSSPTCEPDTYYKRGFRAYPYLRDNVFPGVQKFQKGLRVVLVSNPTGVAEQEEEHMAVVIHCKETKKMDYRYRTYDPNEWKLYQAYLHLKKLPKFNLSYTPDVPEDDVSSNLTSKTSGKKRAESRGGGKGKKVAIIVKLKEVKADRKRSRDDEKEKIGYDDD